VGPSRRPESKVIEESFELAPKTVSGDTTANVQRKGVPNSWSSNSQLRKPKHVSGRPAESEALEA